jgi:hypothetical protein
MAAKRVTFRYRTERPAKLFLGEGMPVECSVYNLSTKGAGLEIPYLKKLPSQFSIAISGTGQKTRCRLAWRNDNKVGIEFL